MRNMNGQAIRAVDVGQYILDQYGPMDSMKLQKLCYYVQAWSLAWGRGPAFSDRIEAWKRGPMIRALYDRHRGQYHVSDVGGDAGKVRAKPLLRATIKDVVKFYMPKTGQGRSELTHAERPWREARARDFVCDDDNSEAEITQPSMRDYYGSLAKRRSGRPVLAHT